MHTQAEMHWAQRWGKETACFLKIMDVNRLIIVPRTALRTETLDHISCAKCRVRAEAVLFSNGKGVGAEPSP